MFKHILVATDASSLADKAVSTALALANSCGARVSALMVVPDYTTQDFAEVLIRDHASFEALQSSLLEAGRRSLDKALAPHADAATHIERCVRVGESTGTTILEFAAREHCDLIVMASRGRGALRSALLGSQTLNVISTAPVPVLVVK